MKKTKLEKGITLVALIITIVVLLILAVVSIGAVKNSGIIGHATNTSDAWKQAQANEAGYLQEYERYVATVGVPIPSGFEHIEGTKDTGLVIKHKTEGSEFVWIPVENGTLPDVTGSEPAVVTGSGNNQYDAVSTNLEKAGMPAGSTKDDFLAQLTNEYNAMKASVKKYKGFYVGRYEVSMSGEKAQSIKGVKPATTLNNSADTWYGLYKLCKTYKTSSATSSMIWGSQWNAMMNFIGSTEANKTGRVSHGLSKTYLTGNGDGVGKYSGTVSYNDIIKNIYDLEGNVREYTLEAKIPKYRVMRGGNCLISFTPNYVDDTSIPSYTDYRYGSRLTLYVEL